MQAVETMVVMVNIWVRDHPPNCQLAVRSLLSVASGTPEEDVSVSLGLRNVTTASLWPPSFGWSRFSFQEQQFRRPAIVTRYSLRSEKFDVVVGHSETGDPSFRLASPARDFRFNDSDVWPETWFVENSTTGSKQIVSWKFLRTTSRGSQLP